MLQTFLSYTYACISIPSLTRGQRGLADFGEYRSSCFILSLISPPQSAETLLLFHDTCIGCNRETKSDTLD